MLSGELNRCFGPRVHRSGIEAARLRGRRRCGPFVVDHLQYGFGSQPRRLHTAFDGNISGTLPGTFIDADSKTCSDIRAFLQPQACQVFLQSRAL